MNFKALATAYDSSESESDEEPVTKEATGLVSVAREKPKSGISGHSTEVHPVHKEKVAKLTTASTVSGDAGCVSTLPPPPTALLGSDDNVLRGRGAIPQHPSKKRKIDGQAKTVDRFSCDIKEGLFLPRQVQTQVPNVSTEDLQSYGMKTRLNKESQ